MIEGGLDGGGEGWAGGAVGRLRSALPIKTQEVIRNLKFLATTLRTKKKQ